MIVISFLPPMRKWLDIDLKKKIISKLTIASRYMANQWHNSLSLVSMLHNQSKPFSPNKWWEAFEMWSWPQFQHAVTCQNYLGDDKWKTSNRGSLSEVVIPLASNKTVVHPFLKKMSLDLTILDNYNPISNFPFLEYVLDKIFHFFRTVVHFFLHCPESL